MWDRLNGHILAEGVADVGNKIELADKEEGAISCELLAALVFPSYSHIFQSLVNIIMLVCGEHREYFMLDF